MCCRSFVCSLIRHPRLSSFFFFNDTATTEIYTLSLHDALPIFGRRSDSGAAAPALPHLARRAIPHELANQTRQPRSEEHTSELQSPCNLVCRLLLEKKKKKDNYNYVRETTPQTQQRY